MRRIPNEKRAAAPGDIVTLDLHLVPENGYVPEPLFDREGRVSFVLGGGNYLPGLHELVEGCAQGDRVSRVSIDSGWGSRRDDLLLTVPLEKLNDFVEDSTKVKVGDTIRLNTDIQVVVTKVNEDNTVILDANPPLAGTSYACSFTVISVEALPCDRYHTATFALGCFWGSELAFMRVPGVVGTLVGYSQGITENPTYEQVCSGRTKHREAVQVVYDKTVVSYEELVKIALERLKDTQSPLELHRLFEEEDDDDDETSDQYKHGFYYHSKSQREVASKYTAEDSNRFGIELLEASTFWPAEEWHQKYLYKLGQTARKGAKDKIRCYG